MNATLHVKSNKLRSYFLAGIRCEWKRRSLLLCTTVIVGKKATLDGSTLNARNCDAETPVDEVEFIVVPANDHQTGTYHSNVTGFEMAYPEKALRYQMVPNVKREKEGIFGEAGINSENVAMSATESIFGNTSVLALDPLVNSGIGEDSLLNMVLPYIHSARDGVRYLGEIIKEHGSHEGNGVIFSDKDEVWYMEIPCGHHWVAQRIPDDHCCVIANQVSQQEIDFSDSDNFMWSEGIQEFVEENHLNPAPDTWNFRRIFGTSSRLDRRYNTSRVWFGQNYFGLKSDDPRSSELPFSFKPNRKLGVQDVAYVLSSHYNETAYDPLGEGTWDQRHTFRPISVSKTQESHILQIRNHVPEKISSLFWLNSAPTAFNPYVPFYANAHDTSPIYHKTSLEYDINQAYWMSRTLAVLVERSYAELHTIVENYLKDCRTTANTLVHQYDKQALDKEAEELTHFLTECNARTAEIMQEKTFATIGLLADNGLALSKLTFNMDKNIL